MQKLTQNPSEEIKIIYASMIWIGLISAEMIASFVLLKAPRDISYYFIALGLSILLFLVAFRLGSKSIANDIQEICLYDVFVQCFGFATGLGGWDTIYFLTLANTVGILKMVRISWPMFERRFNLPNGWPVFGVLGVIRRHARRKKMDNQITDRLIMCCVFPLSLLAGYLWQSANNAYGNIPIASFIAIVAVFLGAPSFIEELEGRADGHRQALHDKAKAEGEAEANARLVAILQAAKEAEERAHAATATALADVKMAKEAEEKAHAATAALLAERNVMMAVLEAHNSRLGDSAHSLKIMLAPLAFKTEALVNLANSDALRDNAIWLRDEFNVLGKKLVRLIDNAYIDPQAAFQTENRAGIADLCAYFMDRFNDIACDNDVSLECNQQDLDKASLAGNEESIKDIIGNLLTNAIKHGQSGDVVLDFTPTAQGVCVSVSNGGDGIPDANGPDGAANFTKLVDRLL